MIDIKDANGDWYAVDSSTVTFLRLRAASLMVDVGLGSSLIINMPFCDIDTAQAVYKSLRKAMK